MGNKLCKPVAEPIAVILAEPSIKGSDEVIEPEVVNEVTEPEVMTEIVVHVEPEIMKEIVLQVEPEVVLHVEPEVMEPEVMEPDVVKIEEVNLGVTKDDSSISSYEDASSISSHDETLLEPIAKKRGRKKKTDKQ